MTSTLCAVVVQTAILLTGANAAADKKPTEKPTVEKKAQSTESNKEGKIAKEGKEAYVEAHRATEKTDKPMVVMVCADWCQPCQMMKRTILPQVCEHGLLKKVAFAIINFDRDRELAQKITGGGPIPQLVMFRRTKDGWASKKLIGSQSVETVEQFIDAGVASKKAAPDSNAENESPAPPVASDSGADKG